MRWPFGPPHLTLKPSNKKHQKKKTKKKQTKEPEKKRKKRRPKKQQQKHQKMAFQLSVKFFLFFGGFSKFPFFDILAQKAWNPKNTIKIGVSSYFFLETSCVSRNGRFWNKKPKIYKFQLIFFGLFSSLSKTKNTKICWNPYFYSVLANLKNENFQNLNSKHWKLKNPIFAPLFLKKAIFRKLANNWKQKKNTNW